MSETELTERDIPTRHGAIRLKGAFGLHSPRPVLVFVRGVFAEARPRQFAGPLLYLADIFEVSLPGLDGPVLDDDSVAGFAAALGEALETAFPYRPVVLCGVSIGAVVAMATQARNLRRVVALEPTLRPAEMWPARGAIDKVLRDNPNSPIARFVARHFGPPIGGEPPPDHGWVLDRLRVPADVLLSDDPLLPVRAASRWPSLVGAADRRRLAANPHVRLRTTGDAGHNLVGQATRAVVEMLQEACRRASAIPPYETGEVDELLIEAVPLAATTVAFVGPGGVAFETALQARAPLAKVTLYESASDAVAAGPHEIVAVAGNPDAETLRGLGAALCTGGRLFARADPQSETTPALADSDLAVGVDAAGSIVRVHKPGGAEDATALKVSFIVCADLLMDIRTRLPTQGLMSEPTLDVRYLQGGLARLSEPPASEADIVILQRPGQMQGEGLAQLMAKAIAKDQIVVLEFDDHPQAIADFFGRPLMADAWEKFVGVHAVQTTTPPLVEAFRQLNPEVRGFENAVFELLPFREPAHPRRIFYGGVKRGRIAIDAARSLKAAVDAFPDLEFVVVGDEEVFDALPTPRKRLLEYLPYEAYLGVMSTCCISLSPIDNRRFLDTKSDAKFLDAARAGVLTIASPTVYDRTIVHGVNGLIAREPADWGELLLRALEDTGWARAMARTAWEQVRTTRMFANQVAARRDWYFDLWNRRAELHEAVMTRVPAVRAELQKIRA